MRTHSKLLLAALAAAMLMAFAVGSASARIFRISNTNIRSSFRSMELGVSGLPTDRCNVTLEGSLHSGTIAKVVGTLLGYITRVNTAECNLTTAILGLPWHVQYRGFSGTLPDITLLMVRVIRARFSASALGFVCLGEPDVEANFDREAGGRITEVRMTAIPSMPVRGGGGFGCPESEGSFRAPNPGTVTLLGNSNDITVTLI